jgi:hypothetical protein
MKHKLMLQKIIPVIIIFMLLVACASSPQAIQTAVAMTQAAWTPTTTSTPLPTLTPSPIPTPILTLTINEMECTLDGPMTIPYGEFMINLVINEQKPTESGYALARLVDGKTIKDLQAWPTMEQPPWLIVINGVHETAGGSHTYSYDLRQIPTYSGEPLFIVCARMTDSGDTAKLGAFGPIEVGK